MRNKRKHIGVRFRVQPRDDLPGRGIPARRGVADGAMLYSSRINASDALFGDLLRAEDGCEN